MSVINYPFDANNLLLKKKSLKKLLLGKRAKFLNKKIAVLGGSTTHEFIDMLELFLLDQGIQPEFYESDYNMYWQEAMFDNVSLINFAPDIIYLHTSSRNIAIYPEIGGTKEVTDTLLIEQYRHFQRMWERLSTVYNCPIIQNNFERPTYRLLGNADISAIYGRSYFISKLNQMFHEYAQNTKNFYINDIDFLSADFGLSKWQDLSVWYMYKYICAIEAIPEFAFSIANIIKSIYGLNKKSFILDLDNTIWGGVVGDDGVEGLAIGQEVPSAEAYHEFQTYIKAHKDIGVVLNICSKNELSNALVGLNHENGVLKEEDFISIKANWDSKDRNIKQISAELELGVDSFVFLDDNPAEREIVSKQLDGVAVPDIGNDVEHYIRTIDRSGYFEMTALSREDMTRSNMYKANIKRKNSQTIYENYDEYLKDLEMVAYISGFEPLYISRITQLTNKTNQFNLTTKRYTEAEIKEISQNENYIRISCRLVDKFGDNGIVSVMIGRIEASALHIDLWLMSCRVIKRSVEEMLFDVLVEKCIQRDIRRIYGHYCATPKNGMVKGLYSSLGFEEVCEESEGVTEWCYDVTKHTKLNRMIKIIL